jgi:hypothetical protein
MKTNGPDSDDVMTRFTIRQAMIGIAIVGVVLAVAVREPCLLVAGGDAVLIGFGVYKVARALRLERFRPDDEPPWFPPWLRMAMAMLLWLTLLGVLIGWLCPVVSH